MFDTLTWVLAGIILYTAIAEGLKRRGSLPDFVSVTGPLATIHTKRGRDFLDHLARHERFWRAWGNFGVGIALVVMLIAGLVVLVAVPAIVADPGSAGTLDSPQNVLVIPGVNDFLPLSAAFEIVFGLVVGLVVHEGGHGLLCRVEDIEIESMGLATFALIPLGAFVEPDHDDQQSADRGAKTRMFAAGITNNFAVCALALVFLLPLAASVAVVAGAPVGDTLAGSGAEDAGIEQGDVITEIDGVPIENGTQFEDALAANDSPTVDVERKDGDPVTVERRVLIFGSVDGVADGIVGTDPLTHVTAVNDTTVQTEHDFARAVDERPVATIETDRGNATIPVGAYIAEVPDDSALGDAGAPTDGTSLIVTQVGDTRVANSSDYDSALDDREPGEEVTVTAYVDDQRQSYDVTLEEDDGASLGVPDIVVAEGYSGFVFDDFGADMYPAEQFLSWLDGSNAATFPAITSILVYMANLLIMPFATLLDPQFSYNFAGFNSDVTSFFVVEGPLSILGGGVFLTINLLFWTWWINFNLALFNCIPAFPLDGGHILRTSTESIVSRLPIENGRAVVTFLTVGVTIGMIVAVMMLIFGPVLL